MDNSTIDPEDCFEVWEAAEDAMWAAAVAFAQQFNEREGQQIIDPTTVAVTFEPGSARRHFGCGCPKDERRSNAA